jgi:MerC mercury resistance protein
MKSASLPHSGQFRLDALGAFLSFACAVHCMVMPVVATVLPLIGLSFLQNSYFELISVGTCLTLAGLSLAWGFTTHRRWLAIGVFSCAAAMLIAARTLWGECSCCSEEINWPQLALAVGGGVLLGTSHLINRRLCRCTAGCCN